MKYWMGEWMCRVHIFIFIIVVFSVQYDLWKIPLRQKWDTIINDAGYMHLGNMSNVRYFRQCNESIYVHCKRWVHLIDDYTYQGQ